MSLRHRSALPVQVGFGTKTPPLPPPLPTPQPLSTLPTQYLLILISVIFILIVVFRVWIGVHMKSHFASDGRTTANVCQYDATTHAACVMDWIRATPEPHFTYYTASLDPTTQEPWCPDCRLSLPVARQMISAAGGTLLEVHVGSRAEWMQTQPPHPLRTGRDTLGLRVTTLPTLVRFETRGSNKLNAGVDAIVSADVIGAELERASNAREAEKVIKQAIARYQESLRT